MAKTRNKPVKNGCAKVPIIMQLEALECGAACLDMILAYYGKWVPLAQVRTDCGVSRDGSKAINILKAARNYGLEAKAYRMELESLKTDASYPCILHWGFDHFVVLDGFRNGKAIINDPARGICELSMEIVDEEFTGVCMLFAPTDQFVADGKQKSVMDFLRKGIRGAEAAALFALSTTVVTEIINVIKPGFTRILIDRLLPGRNPEWFRPFIFILGILFFMQLIVTWLNAVYMLRLNGKIDASSTSSFMWKILRLPMEFFSQRMAGDIQQRKNANASVAFSLVRIVGPRTISAFLMLFYFVVMLRYSIPLTMVGIGSLFINFLVSRYITEKRVNLARVMMRDNGKLVGMTSAGISMIESIKASGAENGYFSKWSGCQASVNEQESKFEEISLKASAIPEIITALADIAVLVSGVWEVMNGQVTIGMIMAFQGYLSSFMNPAMDLVSTFQQLQEMRIEMERIDDVMEYPSDTMYRDEEFDGNCDYQKLSGNIEIRDMSFGYSKLEPPLIDHFNLSVRPGDKIALVGTSGCGKSTISKLISGLYQPWSGEILFDGKKREEISRSVFVGSLAVVDQEIILFEDTIANNIKMFDDSIEDFEMILAARDAQIHDDILTRPGGYRYRIHEGGNDFSGGQRQRMEIARVLAQDPTIIIMDEATSALDAKTEYEVVKQINERGITCIIVAHRLSTIRDCDEIIVMDQGQVVERGTHEELYAAGGMYASLVSDE